MPLLVAGTHPGEARRKATDMLDQVALADRLHYKPPDLSAGQQQRVAVARALVNEPLIVWADEPTGNLDSDTSADVIDLLERLNKELGQTFIIVTHDPTVSARADRIINMNDGRILDQDGTSSTVAGGTTNSLTV